MAKSLIGRLPSAARDIGPVAATSYRVASRIANALRAGQAVRSIVELRAAAIVLFHAPPDQAGVLLDLLAKAGIPWHGKALIFCDCEEITAVRAQFEALGASTAVARQFGIAGRIAVAGSGAALTASHRIARELKLKAVEILPDSIDKFDAVVTLSNAAITPLIDCAASLLREAGIRDTEAARIAAALFLETAKGYAHSGRQSWAWYMRGPEAARIESQIAAAGAQPGPVLRELLLFGLEYFGKHADVGAALLASRAT